MKHDSNFLVVSVLVGCLLVSASGRAQTIGGFDSQSWLNSPYMLGNWNGERTRLENRGVTFNFVFVNDLLVNTQDQVANWSRVRGTVDVDFGKAELVPGLKFHIDRAVAGRGQHGRLHRQHRQPQQSRQ